MQLRVKRKKAVLNLQIHICVNVVACNIVMWCNYKISILVVGFQLHELICTGVTQAPFFCISPPQIKLLWCFWLVLRSSFGMPCPSIGFGSFQENRIHEAFLKFIGSWLKVTLHLFWPDSLVGIPARAQVKTGNSSGGGVAGGSRTAETFLPASFWRCEGRNTSSW